MKEEDIRPQKLFDQYLSLSEKDIETYFKKAPLYYVPCPACSSSNTRFSFRKMGFDYELCENCETLFVNPRPSSEAFTAYYTDSPSVRFWATNFYKETEKQRREQIIKPKAKMVSDILEKYVKESNGTAYVLDIGAGYGVFSEELQKLLPLSMKVYAVEPAYSLQKICREKGIPVIPMFLEDIREKDLPEGKQGVKAAISFELMEHLHNPESFATNCYNILGENGLLILTTLNWKGFDLQVLKEKSKSIHPPHHINFFTTESLSLLLQRTGFEILEVKTPGKLDVDIASKQKYDVEDLFIRRILDSNEDVKNLFQQFLQEANLSSHMMLVAKKCEQSQ